MPFINVKLAGGPISELQYQALLLGMTDRVHRLLGKRKEVTAVVVEDLPARSWSIGGQALPTGTMCAFVDIKITRGTNSADEKADMIAAATALLNEVLGEVAEASYVVIHELDGNAWGYGGITQQERMAGRASAAADI